MLCLLAACQDSDKQRLMRLVEEWEGKEITFPAQAVFTVQGRDTVSFRWQDAPYRIVTYVDSIGCASCKLQLPKWKQLMAETDSLFGKGRLEYVFFSTRRTCANCLTLPVVMVSPIRCASTVRMRSIT